MIPSALCSQLERGLADFLRMSFWSPTPGMEGVIDRLLDTPGAVFKGPYVSAKLPFQQGGADEFFPQVPLGFPAHRHQEQAFERLTGTNPRSTLVATGTGSGKTECFLWPILEYCRSRVGTPGIKAIIVYPMNALATDQAGRIAKAVHTNSALRGGVRAGLYIGESPGQKHSSHKTMGPDHLITDRGTMRLNPPDILLTNYKMLDYLLIRSGDQDLWQHNHGDPLRYLVVDELHTFDGAQGTDLACLIRRLKTRLKVEPGKLCCVGTSATLGGGDSTDTLRSYAEDIFGVTFDKGAVITETRQSPTEFFGGTLIEFAGSVAEDVRDRLDPSRHPTPQEYVAAQQQLWFDEALETTPGSDLWRVELGEQLLRHSTLRNLVTLLAQAPVPLDELVANISRTSRTLREDPKFAKRTLVSFLSLVSEARSWLPERAEAKARREAAGTPRPTRPFLDVRIQIWQRELRRMVADVAPKPTL
ncbi:MAG: DEAD/DEAH box helicase, partial [Proteobacteria bacterium]|nr:DEAD/DEAH box helicase [Pseudomonadota bacterium]